jgi:hypothetical protein
MRTTLALVWLLGATGATCAAELPIFDAHIHYNLDVWESVTPADAAARLRAAGVTRALVSSTSDDGTLRLLAAAPDLVLPALRPYRKRGEIAGWVSDASVTGYLEERLARRRYVALGEFHVNGADADRPVVRRVVELARAHGLVLHAHCDPDALTRLFGHDPQARILWAHAGFEEPERVGALLRRHPRLSADLSMRADVAPGGRLAPAWRALLLELPERFLVGTDTYVPERWDAVGEHAAWARAWLAELPRAAAERIAWRNGAELFGAAPAAQR